MTIAVNVPAATSPAGRRRVLRPFVLSLLLFAPLALVMSWPQLVVVWQTGNFVDTDDAMRAVQVRDLLAGQGWYDLVPHRLDPSHPFVMHWSRVVDVPVALLEQLFRRVADPETAERLARIVFPLALQAGMILAAAATALALAGPRAAVAAALLVVGTGISYGQFRPGRIDHHAPQILLLMLMTGTLVRALDPRRVGQALLLGPLAALSLAISLENLPFLAVILAAPPLAWVLAGPVYAPVLRAQALGLALAVPAAFAVTVAPARWGIVAADALSSAHVLGAVLGAGVLALLAALGGRLKGRAARAGALAAGGGLVLGLLHAVAPAALHDPYVALDPVVRRFWLDHVTEAMPLLAVARTQPSFVTMVICPALVGLAGAIAAATSSRGALRGGWIAVSALVLVGLAGSLWQVRVSSSMQPLAILGAAWGIGRLLDRALAADDPRCLVAAFGLLLSASTFAWAFVPAPASDPATAADAAASAACREASAATPLAGLAPGIAFAPVELGSHLLAHTELTAIGAPYHRNDHGNRLVLDGFAAPPDEARALVTGAGSRYLVFCAGEKQIKLLAAAVPSSLAAALAEGRIPAWLAPVALPAPTPWRVFTVQ